MKTTEEREDDFRQVFDSILKRINELRKNMKLEEYVILDGEVDSAVKDYCKSYNDEVIYND